MPEYLGVAFPVLTRDRRRVLDTFPDRRLPPVQSTRAASVWRRCARCHMQLTVGPRLAATGLRIVCPCCAVTLGMSPSDFWPTR